MPCTWIPRNENQQAAISPPRVWGMPSPAEPVKPVSQPSRASRSEMYSLWSGDGAVRGGCGQGAGPRGRGTLPPYHVGVRGGHDVGVDAVGLHDAPQHGQARRGVGGRRWQVLVAQEDVLGLGGPRAGGLRNGKGERGGAHRWVRGTIPNVIPAGKNLWRPPCSTACGHGDTREPQIAAWRPAGPLLQPRTAPGSSDPRSQPQTPASSALGLLQNSVFLAPGIVDENQCRSLVEEDANLPVPVVQWDHHREQLVPSTEQRGAGRSLPAASQNWGCGRNWLMVGPCPAGSDLSPGLLGMGSHRHSLGSPLPAGTWLLTLGQGHRVWLLPQGGPTPASPRAAAGTSQVLHIGVPGAVPPQRPAHRLSYRGAGAPRLRSRAEGTRLPWP